jgi:DNA-binding transcriptional MocR family regulator
VPVDGEGLDVQQGIAISQHAALAVVTPGQQAPLGMTMTLARRRALLAWAAGHGAYIVEDDYLGELQLRGRAAPALASIDHAGRVLHIGTFSKTISPSLRLGFMVVPSHLALTFAETAACLAPAPNIAIQHTVAEFIREGHYLRHLRKMKRLYAARQQRLPTRSATWCPKAMMWMPMAALPCVLSFRMTLMMSPCRNEPCNTAWRPCRCHRGTCWRQRREACCWGPQTIPSGR